MVNWLLAAKKARLLASLPKYGSLLLRLFRDARVSAALKIGAVAAAVLIISPLDVLGDIPVIGALDDAALLVLLLDIFVRLSPAAIVAEHKAAVGLTGQRRADPLKNVTPR